MKKKLQKIVNAISCFYNYYNFKYKGFSVGVHFRGLGTIRLKINKKAVKLQVGDHFILQSGNFRNTLSRNSMSCIQVNENASLIIGNHVRMSDVSIRYRNSIIIGDYVTIGGDTIIMDSNAHSVNYQERRKETTDNILAKNT